MKVKELIAYLSQHDPELEVLLSSDAEGNSINRLSEVDVSHYNNSSMGYREIELVHPDDLEEYDADFIDDALVLWPL